MECPACQYVRQPEDDAPDWQCPSCKRAYAKARVGVGTGHDSGRRMRTVWPTTAPRKPDSDGEDVAAREPLHAARDEPLTARPAASARERVTAPQWSASGRRGAAPPVPNGVNGLLVAQGLGLLGACLLIAGAFAPFVSVPIVGGVTLFQNGEGDGVFIVGLALVGIVAAAMRWLWATAGVGLLSGAIVTYDVLSLRGALNEEVEKIRDSDFGGILDQNAVADMASGMVSFQWGLALIVIGVALTTLAPFMARRQ